MAPGHPANSRAASLGDAGPGCAGDLDNPRLADTHLSPDGPGSIPWPVPHHAAGGIWRARRAIVVGDPFQVEPIVTLDRNPDARLAERRGVPDRLRATLASAQTLADGANRYGAWITGRRGRPVWVGCPLTVHRRCVEPMFGIANRLAYAGSMVLGDGMLETEARLTAERPLLGGSVWIDVAVQTGGPKHFIPEQAQIVRRGVHVLASEVRFPARIPLFCVLICQTCW